MPDFCNKPGCDGDKAICQVCGRDLCSVCETKFSWRPDLTGHKGAGNICASCLAKKEKLISGALHKTPGKYNATVYEYRDEKPYGVFVAEVNNAGKMLRSNSVQCTGLEGNERYDEYFKKVHPDSTFKIVMDDCDGYKQRLRGLALPPTYKSAMQPSGIKKEHRVFMIKPHSNPSEISRR